LIKRSEGFRNKTYLDIAGHPTIGYGHCLAHNECYPRGIGETEAGIILLWDIREAEQAVSRLVRVELTQGQFGSSRLASSTLLHALNAGKLDAAADELLRWDHAGDHEVAALKARRAAEFRLWTGKAPQRQAAA
jgi:GH24 family phage-related lysozyme (muramidase)